MEKPVKTSYKVVLVTAVNQKYRTISGTYFGDDFVENFAGEFGRVQQNKNNFFIITVSPEYDFDEVCGYLAEYVEE